MQSPRHPRPQPHGTNPMSWKKILLEILIAAGLIAAAVAGCLYYCARMPGVNWQGPAPTPTAEQTRLAVNLERHVRALSETPRNQFGANTLIPTRVYLTSFWEELALPPQRQEYFVNGVPYYNVFVTLPGTAPNAPILVVGAHYDSVPGSPGADDNASGVAALLEITRLLAHKPLARAIHLVAFANEEKPFFATQDMGSMVYARSLRDKNIPVAGMWSLEMLGYYDDTPGSQAYPPPFQWFYPDTGNFIGFVANLDSRAFLHRSIETFREHAQIPSQGTAAPDFIPELGLSDHASFWYAGIPAIMITDTALFRNPNYHAETDTPDTLDYVKMARVVEALAKALPEVARNPGE